MADPVFHLDGIVKTKESMEDFDGPLSLILQLLARNKVEIKNIRISEILDQYLEYLNEMERMDLEVASEFVAMASYLMYIKAKTLLQGTEETEELDTLISSLEQQQRRQQLEHIKEAALWLAGEAGKGDGLFVRGPQPLPGRTAYEYSHLPSELIQALVELLGRESEKTITPALAAALPAERAYPIGVKADEILMLLRDEGDKDLRALLYGSRDKPELVASLMAILELYRSERIEIYGDDNTMKIRLYGDSNGI